ncbi:hypothetical protein ACFQI7_21525 [Paenibacillus allorhizosphaerae]|nr:hypothetical protein [Paenibacillus allorhizosphaerae]
MRTHMLKLLEQTKSALDRVSSQTESGESKTACPRGRPAKFRGK